MLVSVVLVIEILSVIICIHRIYGQKIRFDVCTILFCLLVLLILESINRAGMSEVSASPVYILIYLYCKIRYKETYIKTGISMFLLGVIMTAMQFMCLFFTNLVISNNEITRTIVVNIEVLLFCIFLLPKCRVDRLRRNLRLKNKYMLCLLAFSGGILLLPLLQDKLFKRVQAEIFIFAVPTVVIVVILVGEWNNLQKTTEKMEKTLRKSVQMQKNYDSLLNEVRLRQHGFKNHLTAIFSTHYTYKTYEKLVHAQEEYCKKLIHENRDNHLLLIGDNVLAGFLYEKFQEIEEGGICVEYKICTKIINSSVNTYYIVEILGILIDNAAEAVKESKEKKIIIEVVEDREKYYFVIRNVYKYVPYSELGKWFQIGRSSKGRGHGMGLYYVMCLCKELDCDIRCENVEIEERNWIQFTFDIKKKTTNSP